MNEQILLQKLRTAYCNQNTTGFIGLPFVHAFGNGREALLYASLYWPEFVELKGMVFLRALVETDADLRRVDDAFERYGRDPVKTERAFNVIEIPPLFGSRVGETDDDEDHLLASLLAETWYCRLRSCFPDRCFEISVLEADESGREVAITFNQKPGN